MKHMKLVFVFLLFITVGYGQNDSQAITYTSNKSKVELKGKFLEFSKSKLQFEFTLENKSSENIYFANSPIQITGEQGYYISVDETGDYTIKVSSRVYLLSPYYSPPSNDTSVILRKLDMGEKFSEKISLSFPLKETIPPNNDPYKIKKIIPKKIKKIEISIGYFFEDEGLLDFLKTKPQGWYINGIETFFSGQYIGKRLYEIQQVVSADIKIDK